MLIQKGLLCIAVLITSASSLTASDEEAVQQAITDFRLCADLRDVQLAERVLHADFRNFYVFKGELSRLDKAGYIDMLEQKLIGGEARTQKISGLEIMGGLAVAVAHFSGGDMNFEQHISLVKSGGAWQIVNVMLNFKP